MAIQKPPPRYSSEYSSLIADMTIKYTKIPVHAKSKYRLVDIQRLRTIMATTQMVARTQTDCQVPVFLIHRALRQEYRNSNGFSATRTNSNIQRANTDFVTLAHENGRA